jgi:hypothetical protein
VVRLEEAVGHRRPFGVREGRVEASGVTIKVCLTAAKYASKSAPAHAT